MINELGAIVKDTSRSCIFDFPDRPSRPTPPEDGDGNPIPTYPYEPIDDWPNIDPHPEDPGSDPYPPAVTIPPEAYLMPGLMTDRIFSEVSGMPDTSGSAPAFRPLVSPCYIEAAITELGTIGTTESESSLALYYGNAGDVTDFIASIEADLEVNAGGHPPPKSPIFKRMLIYPEKLIAAYPLTAIFAIDIIIGGYVTPTFQSSVTYPTKTYFFTGLTQTYEAVRSNPGTVSANHYTLYLVAATRRIYFTWDGPTLPLPIHG